MSFFQEPPRLGNQYDDDPVLREYLEAKLPDDTRRGTADQLRELGQLGGVDLYQEQLADRLNEPVLTQWDPWGKRIDHIELTTLWKKAQRLTAEHGLVATAYEHRHGPVSRVVMFAMNFLVQPSLDVYSCPLAMTDGAARTLLDLNARELQSRALPHLLARDPDEMWTSGQWMTERTGGSDVGLSETVAKKGPDGFRLFGTKWFTSATTSEMTLTLARPEGNGPGGRGLALFYLETRRPDGSSNGIQIHRFKDKLGTRKVPTAELTLDGALAIPVAGLDNGIRNITPMLNITRTWNTIGAAGFMRRVLALAKDYAQKRSQFGDLLVRKPLHVDTLAGMAAEAEGAFLLAFRVAELLGKIETNVATDLERLVFRLATPLAKLTTAKQAVAVVSEGVECFGGAGYVEDTGLPLILRDAQVLPIWEGTTNVLSLDALRSMAKDQTLQALTEDIDARLSWGMDANLTDCVRTAKRGLEHATSWVQGALSDPAHLEAGARRFALTLGRTLELSLLVEHADWALKHGKGQRALAAARRFAQHGVDVVSDMPALDDSRALVS